jgi:hypothetical protein
MGARSAALAGVSALRTRDERSRRPLKVRHRGSTDCAHDPCFRRAGSASAATGMISLRTTTSGAVEIFDTVITAMSSPIPSFPSVSPAILVRRSLSPICPRRPMELRKAMTAIGAACPSALAVSVTSARASRRRPRVSRSSAGPGRITSRHNPRLCCRLGFDPGRGTAIPESVKRNTLMRGRQRPRHQSPATGKASPIQSLRRPSHTVTASLRI